jgi:hypothetical protein
MTQPKRADKQAQADQRQARLAAELRANLKKRKQQARGRETEARTIQDAGRDEQGSR